MTQIPAPFDIVETSPGRFCMAGEFDANATERFEKALASYASTDVSIDMSAVSFIDSSGLRSIVGHHQRAVGADGRLRLVSPSAQVVRLLELSKLVDHLEVES